MAAYFSFCELTFCLKLAKKLSFGHVKREERRAIVHRAYGDINLGGHKNQHGCGGGWQELLNEWWVRTVVSSDLICFLFIKPMSESCG